MLRALLLLFLAAGSAFAAPVVKTEHVEAELIAEKAAFQAGKPATVGLRLRMEPQWHTYWKNPGDSGLPTKIEWVLPEGWKAGPIQWPYPQPLPVGTEPLAAEMATQGVALVLSHVARERGYPAAGRENC